MNSLYVICYDISKDRLRTRIEKVLSGYGKRVQYSVFESWLDNESYSDMKSKIRDVFEAGKPDPSTDSIRMYKLCEACKKNVNKFGLDKSPQEGYIII